MFTIHFMICPTFPFERGRAVIPAFPYIPSISALRFFLILATGLFGFLTAPIAGKDTAVEHATKQRHAILIGVDQLSQDPMSRVCPYPEKDMADLGSLLAAEGWVVDRLTASGANNRTLGAPTYQGIKDAIHRAAADDQLGVDDTVIVCYSGPALVMKVFDTGSAEFVEEMFLCGTDADIQGLERFVGEANVYTADDVERFNLISIQNLYKLLGDFDSSTRSGFRVSSRLLLVDPIVSPNATTFAAFVRDDEAAEGEFVFSIPDSRLCAMFSCSESLKRFDDDNIENGLFFHFVERGLKGAADADGDSNILVSELLDYVGKSVVDYVHEYRRSVQTPVVRRLGTFDGSLAEFRFDASCEEAGCVRSFHGLPRFRLSWVPPGEFVMGSPATETGRGSDEAQVNVNINSGFWMGQTEITAEQWYSLMARTVFDGPGGHRTMDDCAVSEVSWFEATEYCRRLTLQSRQAGRIGADQEFRLPTEAEWEYACRAGTSSSFYFGSDPSELAKYEWYRENTTSQGCLWFPVGANPGNDWNLLDMCGGVQEWCSDWYAAEYLGGSDPRGPKDNGDRRVLRGGDFGSQTLDCRCAVRDSKAPILARGGFRVVLARTVQND